MNIEFCIEKNVLKIIFKGELDECTASFTRNYIDDVIKQYDFDSVVFDMSNLEFMDSTGIGVLLGRYKILKAKQKNMYIYNPSPIIEKIINMSGIYEIMPKIS